MSSYTGRSLPHTCVMPLHVAPSLGLIPAMYHRTAKTAGEPGGTAMADATLDSTASSRPIDSAAGKLFAGAVLAGCAVALLAGIYGKAHDPASETTVKWFFTSTLHLKAWFTSVALLFAILQVF